MRKTRPAWSDYRVLLNFSLHSAALIVYLNAFCLFEGYFKATAEFNDHANLYHLRLCCEIESYWTRQDRQESGLGEKWKEAQWTGGEQPGCPDEQTEQAFKGHNEIADSSNGGNFAGTSLLQSLTLHFQSSWDCQRPWAECQTPYRPTSLKL